VPTRCFLAIDLEPPAVALLGAAREALLESAPDWAGEKWVVPGLLHVTLVFVGPLQHAQVPDALADVRRVSAGHGVHALALARVRARPSPGRASMLWATLDGEAHHTALLARELADALEYSVGLRRDRRAFVPHVTLVRARSPRPIRPDALAAADAVIASGKDRDGSVSVRSVTMYSSTLGPQGPHYEPLGSAPLGS
jgi:2'-5' RNA ligase